MSDTEPGTAPRMTTGDRQDGGGSEVTPNGRDTGGAPPADDSVIQAGREESARMTEQVKAAAREVGSKAHAAARQEPKPRWGAAVVAAVAGAGIIAGVLRRRRNHKRRSRWPWKRR